MEPSWPENSLSVRDKIATELLRGHGFANQLKILLDTPPKNYGYVSSEDLSEKIVDSFKNALLMLSDSVESHDVSQAMMNYTSTSSPISSCGKSEGSVSGESFKSITMRNDRRRCCKTRKKNAHTQTNNSPIPIHDGHSWRKYGQKYIQDCKHPRSYFRCSYKTDLGCQAQKHEQKIQDDPPVYTTTYFGDHTCENPHKVSPPILDHTHIVDDDDNSCSRMNMIRFDQYDKSDQVFPTVFPWLQQEIGDEVEMMMADQSWPSDCLLSLDSDAMMMIESPKAFGTEVNGDPTDSIAFQFDFN